MYEIPAPMLAKAVTGIPDPARHAGGLQFEPKWDGFRAIVAFDGREVEIGSRGAKPLTRYFPELVEAFSRLLPGPCLLDGEIVVPGTGGDRLQWDVLSQRIHPAASRVRMLSEQHPAMFVAFDLLAVGERMLTDEPLHVRRAELERMLAGVPHPVHLTRTTRDASEAADWLTRFEGAGLDGVVAKPLDAPYTPGARTMLKSKHSRTADVVALGYRIHKSGRGVGSLLVGLFDHEPADDGAPGDEHAPRQVGAVAAFTAARRLELVDELEPLVERGGDGAAVIGEGERSRFTGAKDTSFVRLRAERVLEVRYDQLEGRRFRHTVQFVRWRPDRTAHSCTFAQLEQVPAYDLADVLD